MTPKYCFFMAGLLIANGSFLPFLKMTLDNQRWIGSETQDSNFLSCSLSCQLKNQRSCSLFSWSNAKCYHGQVSFTWERSNDFSDVFINSEHYQQVLLQDKVEASGMVSAFGSTIHVFKQWMFLIGRVEETRANAKTTCERVGGHFPIVYNEGIFNFIVDNIMSVVELERPAWVGLDIPNSLPECYSEECNGKFMWTDGTTFEHKDFFLCTSRHNTSVGKAVGMVLRYQTEVEPRQCDLDLEPPFAVIRAADATHERSVICQIQV